MSGHVNASRVCTGASQRVSKPNTLSDAPARAADQNICRVVMRVYPVSRLKVPRGVTEMGSEHVARVCSSVISHLDMVPRPGASQAQFGTSAQGPVK